MSTTFTMSSATVGAIISSFLLASFAFAMETSVGTAGYDLKTAKKIAARTASVDGACVATAVGVREDALIAAHTAHNTAIGAALGVRKTELMAAWNLADAKERRTAREAAWKKFRDARKAAGNEMRAATKKGYDNFNTATKACGVQYKEQPEAGSGVSL